MCGDAQGTLFGEPGLVSGTQASQQIVVCVLLRFPATGVRDWNPLALHTVGAGLAEGRTVP